ncbi:PAS domain-containing sensor histidine kinase [Pseudoalteromonas aurantia]|uniref:histidine kinase n=1 Tax=Pseudoalteromonas aurantia 208 TaxID=1314867 RepID=A0ABR9ELS0_9GAMM|nr:PAS domain-containing sensor histidine kinase [Pseudoalteromonas aurantia]MBE0370668.1 hypothetical protein [Pseudoalteromonas aurantia 208]
MEEKTELTSTLLDTTPYDQNEFNDLLFENIPGYAFVKDEHYKIVKANAAFLSMYPENSRDKVIGYTTVEDYQPDEAEQFLAMDKKALIDGYSETIETINFPDNSVRTLLTRKKRFLGTDGSPYILGICTDITEREHLIKQLKKSNQDLDQFAYIASHDLRAPLNAIAKLASWIDEDYKDELPSGAIEHFSLIKNRIDRMTCLLNDMLTYSRVNQTPRITEEFSLKELVFEQFDMMSVDHAFNVTCKDLTISMQKDAITIVLRNLLSNAIKHHHLDSGSINVDISENRGFYTITVSDDGPGIDSQYHAKVFEMFQTLKPRDQQEGSGIGLSICKKIVRNYGGDISIRNNDVGTSFIISWPSVSVLKHTAFGVHA